jgi:hypothetical protein
MEKITHNDFEYTVYWSDEVYEKEINEFNNVKKKTSKENGYIIENDLYNVFIEKYFKNIYGPSVIVFVHNNSGEPVAVRAFWRNDISSNVAYQPCDTCVIKEYQRKGIFEKMTILALQKVPKKAIVYNYPNPNSYKGYLKLGWELSNSYRLRFFFSMKQYISEHPTMIDKKYFDWWIKPKMNRLFIAKRNNKYFLLKKKSFYYVVVGQLDSEIAKQYNSIKPLFIFYRSLSVFFYNKNRQPLNVVIYQGKDVKIPLYKIDFL